MKWMIDVCEKWNWDQLAEMTEEDMDKILEGWSERKSPSYVEVRGVRKAYAPSLHSVAKRLFAVCPVVGYISPWAAGLMGFAAGAGVAVGTIAVRTRRA
jgi:precorrin-2 dehydrogenase/sirohydrochlorin ferrochelatase